MLFYLGTHQPQWLGLTDVPLFVSHRRLTKRKTFPRALGPWALDSGGFSELSMFGEWRTTPEDYVAAVRRYMAAIGKMQWAAIQDWMCEPFIVARTGLSVVEHQRRTIENYLTLTAMAPEIPWAPVIQGFVRDDYHRHIDDYEAAGVDLRAMPIVGVGSICRRQGTELAARILRSISVRGINVHAFGIKTLGLRKVGDAIESSDSLAWSFNARRNPPLAGCRHRNCANCLRYALRWRERIVNEGIQAWAPSPQMTMFAEDTARWRDLPNNSPGAMRDAGEEN